MGKGRWSYHRRPSPFYGKLPIGDEAKNPMGEAHYPLPDIYKSSQTWDDEQAHLHKALLLLGHTSKARAVLQCGHTFNRYTCIYCHKHADFPLSCYLRLCPRCAVRRSLQFLARHHQAIKDTKRPKLLTLTLKSHKQLSAELLDKLNLYFAKLRRRTLWTNNVAGGMAGLELTHTNHGWHPHIHALIDSDYIPQPSISRAWKRITQGSYIVDIREVTTSGGVYEVAKYIAKGRSFYDDPSLLHQFLDTTKGRRFFTTFGSYYGQPNHNETIQTPSEPRNRTTFHWSIMERAMVPDACHFCGNQVFSAEGPIDVDPIEPIPFQIPF